MNQEAKAAWQLALAMVLVGTIGVFVEEVGLDPVTTVFFRCVFGAATLGLWCWRFGLFAAFRPNRRSLGLILLGGAAIVINWVLFFRGFQLTSIALATVVYHVQPFWVVLLGALLFRERIGLDRLVWMALALTGLALAVGVEMPEGEGYLTGVLLVLGASALYAVAALAGKALKGVPAEVTAFAHTVIGVLLLAPLVSFEAVPATWGPWPWLLGLGVLHTGIVYVLMYRAYPHLPTPMIAILAFVYPVVAILVDYLVYGRALAPVQWGGLGLIALGSLGVTLRWRLVGRRALA